MAANGADIEKQVNELFANADWDNLLTAVITLILCIIGIKIVLGILRKVFEVADADDRVSKAVLSFVRIAMLIVMIIMVAASLGINTNSIVAVLSVLSLGIALAAENIVANLAGGMILYSTKPFKVGDFVKIGGFSGTVKAITLNHTDLHALDGTSIIIPNKIMSSSEIINYSERGGLRLEVNMYVSYMNSIEFATGILEEACKTIPAVKSKPEPLAWISEFDSSNIVVTVQCWVKPKEFETTKHVIRGVLYQAMLENGISVDYEHMTVKLDN